MKKLYRIKELADIYGVSVDTLRIYERMNILDPEFVNEKTGYRYYSSTQITKLKFILSLKSMGFTLLEIKKLMLGQIDVQKKKEQLLMQIEQINEFLLLYDEILSSNVRKATIKTIPEHYAIKTVAHLNSWMEISGEFEALTDQLIEYKLTEPVTAASYAVFYDEHFKMTDLSCTAYLIVNESTNPNVTKMPAQRYLSCIHHGGYDTLAKTYEYLYGYAKRNGYKIIGYPLERYIVGSNNQYMSSDLITELCLPIEND